MGSSDSNGIRVTTADGVVEGVRGKRTRRGVISWKGIPFAAPAVAGNRFRAPQPVDPWPGVRQCHGYGKAAIQDRRYTATAPGRYQPMGEDCLTLNVFAPERASRRPRPVMVFIHGGANILGTTATPLYDGSLLARGQDVIVVTIQYRLGAFGYLDLTEYSTDGRRYDSNLGLKDQVAALRWVQTNIAAFGGDPDNVTVFGESAGGAAVVTLLATPDAKGLFARAIAESPAPGLVIKADSAKIFADEFLRLLRDPQRRPTEVDTTTGPMPADEAQALLARSSSYDIFRAGGRLMKFASIIEGLEPFPFGPVVDGAFLPRSPLDAAGQGETLPVPLVIGTNRSEATLFTKLLKILPESDRMLAQFENQESRDTLAALYRNGREDLIDLAGDTIFWGPTVSYASGHSLVAPTFVYRYDFTTRVLEATGFGATHATELFAVFGAYRTAMGAGLAIADWASTGRVMNDVQDRWGAFATAGVPGAGWPEYHPDTRKVLIIDDPDRVETDPNAERRQAWTLAHATV